LPAAGKVVAAESRSTPDVKGRQCGKRATGERTFWPEADQFSRGYRELPRSKESHDMIARPTQSGFDAVGLDLVVERLTADAEAFGGLQFVAAGFLEHLDDGIALDALEQGEAGVASAFTGGGGDGQISTIHNLAFAQEHRALHFVLQLADVARPVELPQQFGGGGRVAGNDAVGLRGKAFQKRICQRNRRSLVSR